MSKKYRKSSWKSKKTINLGNKPKPQNVTYNLHDFGCPKGIFDSFINDIKTTKKPKMMKLSKIHLLDNPSINESLFEEKLSKIESLSYKETMGLVKSSYGEILLLLDGNLIDEKYELFFKCLSEFSKEVHFNYDLYGLMNNIAYNAIMYMDISESIQKSILEITDRINTYTLCHLRADTGVDIDVCNLISLAKCSASGIKSVDRVNKMMCFVGDVFDVQTIIDIYESLYDNIAEVYGATTTLKITEEDSKIQNPTEVITKQVEAVVAIVNQSPDWMIDAVLDFCNDNFDSPNQELLEVLTDKTDDNKRLREAIMMRNRA